MRTAIISRGRTVAGQLQVLLLFGLGSSQRSCRYKIKVFVSLERGSGEGGGGCLMTQMHAARARSRQHTTPRRYRVAGPASGISLAWAWFISEKVPLTYPLFVCVGKRGGGEGGGVGLLKLKNEVCLKKALVLRRARRHYQPPTPARACSRLHGPLGRSAAAARAKPLRSLRWSPAAFPRDRRAGTAATDFADEGRSIAPYCGHLLGGT